MKNFNLKNSLLALGIVAVSSLHAQVAMTVDATNRGPKISPYQWGLFFEEINHAGDGGLYAELVRNRSFEDNSSSADNWVAVNGATMSLVTDGLLNGAQGHALKVVVSDASSTAMKGVANTGFWGMHFVKDSVYTLSMWVKPASDVFMGHVFAQLQDDAGAALSNAVNISGTMQKGVWSKLTATVKATGDAANGRLALLSTANGTLVVDVVSLFPYTWKGRKNGMRPDLAQLLADTHPRFMRFPGGCFVEGHDSLVNAFQWKKSIGPIEGRPGHLGNWGYRSSEGLGFDEYLQFCNDIGAAPLFVVSVGMGHNVNVPIDDVDTLVQNTLDAIEYANGDVTTAWGAKRAANGHPEPYGLKFIEIGNENYQSGDVGYPERYYKFYKAIKAKYPEITCIGNVEAWGTDAPSWRNSYPVDIVDEHYYRSGSWMQSMYHKYDNQNRSIKVYNGEFAANQSGTYGTYGNMNSALGEAIYMLGQENNSDVCHMGSFAPIFTHESDPHWPYDMIHFNASKNFCTPSYYVQRMFGQNSAGQNLKWTETGNNDSRDSLKIGVGSWNTQTSFDEVSVIDGDGNVKMDDTFDTDAGWTNGNGEWSVADGVKKQTSETENCMSVYNKAVTGANYTMDVKCKKDAGSEGFLVMFYYQDASNYAWWNVGGWSNTANAIEVCRNGTKSTLVSAAGSLTTGKDYDLKVTVKGDSVYCYMDGTQVHAALLPSLEKKVYQSVQLDSVNGMLYVKIVNPNSETRTVNLNLRKMTAVEGAVERLSATSGTMENDMNNPYNVIPTEETLTNLNTLTIPAFSMNIFKIKVKDIAAEAVDSVMQIYQNEDADKYGYLNCHMNGSSEITNYALSLYGTYFDDLIGHGEVFDTKAYTTTGGMRDAYMMRTKKNNFILVGTDMTSALGWNSNHIMDVMLSNDMIHWTKEVKIDLQSADNLKALGLTQASDIVAAWAPQVIYDPASGNYMMYYSVGFKNASNANLPYHCIYYTMLDENLNILTSPKLLFDPGYRIIDADIVYNAEDKNFVMTYKQEDGFHLYQAVAKYVVPAAKDTKNVRQWTVNPDFEVYEGGTAIEAPSLFRMIGSKQWKVAWVNYGGRKGYKMMDLDEHCQNPTNLVYIQGNISPQHGSFLTLTEKEYKYLQTWDNVKTLIPTIQKYANLTKNASFTKALAVADSALTTAGTLEQEIAGMNRALVQLQRVQNDYKALLIQSVKAGQTDDLTSIIVNGDFAAGTSGWTQSPTMGGATGNVAEYFSTDFDFSQTITDLPEGLYEVGVQTFYRAGAIDAACTSHTTGTEAQNVTLYANDSTVKVMSLYDSDQYTYTTYTYPDNIAGANSAFNTDGQYHNTVKAVVGKNGILKIGMRKTSTIIYDWCCFDNFTLKYLGNSTDVSSVMKTDVGENNSIYDLQGRKMPGKPFHGIYIQKAKKYIRK